MSPIVRKAATVAVIKDSSEGIEVLLMKRHHEDRFLPDYYVFPGGALDEQDFCFGFSGSDRTQELKRFADSPENYYAHIICGIRETFEESGLLLSIDENGSYPSISTIESVKKYSQYRKLVFEKKLSFKEMSRKEKLLPAVNNFFYLDRWVTPAIFPIRYDARFFVVIAPAEQEVSHDNNELTDFQWLNPSLALRRYRAGSSKMVTPTVSTLGLLSRFDSAGDVILHLKDRL